MKTNGSTGRLKMDSPWAGSLRARTMSLIAFASPEKRRDISSSFEKYLSTIRKLDISESREKSKISHAQLQSLQYAKVLLQCLSILGAVYFFRHTRQAIFSIKWEFLMDIGIIAENSALGKVKSLEPSLLYKRPSSLNCSVCYLAFSVVS